LDGCNKYLDQINSDIDATKKLWMHIKDCQATFVLYLKNKWGNINPGEMEDEIKKLRKGLIDLRGIDKKSNAFMGI
jgi:dynein heavy chain, axonemal